MDQVVTHHDIPMDTLEGIGLLPNSDNVLTPKQKDMFADFPQFSDGIGGEQIKKETEDKVKADAEKAAEAKTEEPKTEIPKPAAGDSLDTLADEISKTVNETIPDETETPEETKTKDEFTTKRALVNYIKKKIEAGTFLPYSDYDETKQKLPEYLNALPTDQLEELLDKNSDTIQNKVKEEYPQEFFNSLPGHLKYVANALAEGKVPPADIYASLLRVEQARNLDPKDNNDQVAIAQNYLAAKNFGTQEQINQQIEEWKEADLLGKKATQFKPQLDNMQEQQVAAYARQAEEVKVQQQEAAQWYAHSVEEALKDGDLGGLKISRKQQKDLYDKLLLDIKPSVRDGKPMNALWQAMERISYVQPDFKTLAKLTWLATDPKGYDEFVMQQGRNEQQGKVTKELKTLQGSGQDRGEEIPEPQKRKPGIVKQRNPFDTATR